MEEEIQPSTFPPAGNVKKPAPDQVVLTSEQRITNLEKDLADFKARVSKKIAFL